MLWSALFLTLSPLIYAASLPVHDNHDHSHSVSKRLPTSWYFPDDHPVHALFRHGPTDGGSYPQVGTPTWSAAYPVSTPDVNALPKPWVDAFNAAVAAGKIPNIPQSSNTPGVNPVYPPGVNPNGPEVCSATYKCRIPGDIWDAPAGYFGTSFDDGPLPVTSPRLLQFLQSNNQTATHFMIGVNILQNPQIFLDTFNAGHDIAVHTWTHPYMTTRSNLEIVAQLGWTAELIRNSTGGRVPRYWRPPYGDSDMRVRSIAKEVFGLETVIWNQDTEDWGLTTGATLPQSIHDSFVQWLAGPKTPGLIVLEHEVSEQSVSAFIDAFPLIGAAGWKTESLANLIGDSVYQNSKDNDSPVKPDGILVGAASAPGTAGLTSQKTSSTSSLPSSAASTVVVTSTTASTPSAATNAAQTSQTSNAASSLVRSKLPLDLPFLLISVSAPALMTALSLLA